MTRTAGIYVRISDDKEGRALGVDRQERDCRKLAEVRGWEVVGVYSDNDRSATSGRPRPAWEQLLRDLEAHKLDAVVAYSSSRMYRRPRDLQRLIDLTKQNGGVEIATVASGRIVLDSADGRMLAGILAQVDQAEAERTAERVARKHLEKAEQGLPHGGGRRPFGYEWDHEASTWRIRDNEAATVRRIAKHLLSGRSLTSIVGILNTEGVGTATGSRWANGTVRKLMLTPTVAGLRVHRRTGTRTKGNWKGIITPKQRELLITLFADPTRPKRGGGPRDRKRLLSGILVCGRCGSKMYGDGPSGYVCHKSWKGCGNVRISSAPLEDWVWTKAIDRVKDLEKRGGLKELAELDDGASDLLMEERLGLFQRRDELAIKLAEEIVDDRAYAVGVKTLDNRIEQIDQQIGALVRSRVIREPHDQTFFVPVPKVGVNFTALLERKELLERYEFLTALIEGIEVSPASRRGVRWEPERLRIIWRKRGTFRLPKIA